MAALSRQQSESGISCLRSSFSVTRRYQFTGPFDVVGGQYGATGALQAISAVVIIGISLAAVPAGATTAQTKFVKDVRYLDPTTAATASNKQIVKLGSEVCTDLRSGTSVKRLARVLSGTEKAIVVEDGDRPLPHLQGEGGKLLRHNHNDHGTDNDHGIEWGLFHGYRCVSPRQR